LNALDAILEKILSEIGAKICLPQQTDKVGDPSALAEVSQAVIDGRILTLKAILKFTSSLLENSSSRSMYNSAEV
jgi:hypothetical protein